MSEYTIEEINKSREKMINKFVKNHGGKRKLKHIGQIFEEDISKNALEFYRSKIQGDEECIEFHKFELRCRENRGKIIIIQWRLRFHSGKSQFILTTHEQ